MKSCPECGGDVRTDHSFCPKCAAPISAAAKATHRKKTAGDDSATQSSETDGDVLGMDRRTLLLAGGGGLVAAAGGGAAGFLLLTGGGDDGPEAVATAFVRALDAGNTEEASGLVHPDSPMQGNLGTVASLLEEPDITIESTTVVSEGETSTEVEVEATTSLDGESRTETATVTLERQGGEWLVMNFQ